MVSCFVTLDFIVVPLHMTETTAISPRIRMEVTSSRCSERESEHFVHRHGLVLRGDHTFPTAIIIKWAINERNHQHSRHVRGGRRVEGGVVVDLRVDVATVVCAFITFDTAHNGWVEKLHTDRLSWAEKTTHGHCSHFTKCPSRPRSAGEWIPTLV